MCSHTNQNTINSINISATSNKIAKIESDLQNWNIPRESFKKVYKTGHFDFIKNYNIKTSESTVAINKNIETIKLLAVDDINRYRKDYKFLHVGLIQVAVKPLYRLGLDVPICLLLRDNRLLNFDDSLLAVLQSNLANGPVYFNCYPNYSIDINDQNIIDTLTLNVKTKNMNSKANTREIAIIYRVYYRLMKTTLAPKAKMISNKGVTMLMEANHNHNNTFVPKMIKWDDVLTKDNWHFDSITEPEIEEENSNIDQIIQFSDGSIDLKFIRSQSFSQASSSKRMSFSRPSFSKTMEEDDISLEEIERKLKGLDFSDTIPKVEYEFRKIKPIKSTSPTASEMLGEKDSLCMIRSDDKFEPDFKHLDKLWVSPENSIKRQWYIQRYSLKES